MIRRPPRSTQSRSSAASDVYKRQVLAHVIAAKSGAIVEFDQLQAVLILLAQRREPAIVLIEDAELHHIPPRGRLMSWRRSHRDPTLPTTRHTAQGDGACEL